MSKNLFLIGLPLILAAAGLSYLLFGNPSAPSEKSDASLGDVSQRVEEEKVEPTFQPVEVAKPNEVPPIEEAKDPFETKKEEEDPWGHFKGKGPRNVPPDYVMEDGTLVWEKWPMMVEGKYVYGRVEAKPTAPMPILPDDIPEHMREQMKGARKNSAALRQNAPEKKDG